MRRLGLLLASLALLGASCAPSVTPFRKPAPSPYVQPSASAPDSRAAATPTTVTTSSRDIPTFPGVLPAEERRGKQIRLTTNKGVIVFTLFGDEAPIGVSNFIWLTTHNFYDGLTFHRYEPGFVIQGGDPDGDGTGGPPWRIREEPVTRPYLEGTVAMAKTMMPNSTGSQFFIMLADRELNPEYTIIGKVTTGLDVVHELRAGDLMTTVAVEDV